MTSKAEILHHVEQKKLAYHGLAKAYARNDNGWMALHAQAMSDFLAAEKVLRSHGEPVLSFLQQAEQTILSRGHGEVLEARTIAEEIRKSVESLLSEELRGEWEEELLPLDYLKDNVTVSRQQIEAMKKARLQGGDAQQAVEILRTSQGRKIAEANIQWERGDVWKASSEAYDADLTGYEAWLIQRSIALHDTDFVQCELLWGIGCAALEQLKNLPANPTDAVFLIRSRLAWALTPQEAISLSAALKGLTFA